MTGATNRGQVTRTRRGVHLAAGLLLLAALVVARPGRAEEDRVGGGVELRQLKVVPDQRLEDVLGLTISFRYRVGRVDTDKALYLVTHFSAGEGQKLRALVESASLRDRDGFLHAKKQLLTAPRLTWREESLFVPYYAMKLAPGRHELTLGFEALSDPGSCKAGERPRSLPIVGEGQATATIERPPYKMVQLLVEQVEVERVPTDRALLLRWKRLPDLQWQARFRAGAGGVVHNSETRDNVWSASWTRYSAPFPFGEGDRLTLFVLDEDLLGDDELGRVTLTLEDLLTRDHSTPLVLPGVKRLLLGPVKVR